MASAYLRLLCDRRRLCILSATLAGSLIAILSLQPLHPAVIWNGSPSLPIGLYGIGTSEWRVGDIVAINPGTGFEDIRKSGALPRHRLLLKRIVAAGGDIVCRDGDSILINGVPAGIVLTSLEAAIPQWRGCGVPGDGLVFVMGEHPRSLDSRYFGPLSAEAIVGVASPLLLAPVGKAR